MSNPASVKGDLIPYSAEYSQTVRSWIDSEETHQNVCRGTGFPPPGEIIDSWQREGVQSFLLVAGNKPVGYAELWNRSAEMAIEIAHLIVDPRHRSEGFGTRMLELLYERAAQRKNTARVMISLYGESTEALGCYLKAGFELVSTTTYTTGLKLVRLVE